MEVLSNKEIYVLLKILKEKNNVKLDKNFTQKELEHLQSEICNAENKTPAEVLTIENTYKNMLGMSLHDGYKITISDFDFIVEYANKYIELLIDGNLIGITEDNNICQLFKDYYSKFNNSADIDLNDYIVDEIKYAPIVLFAHLNKLIDLKSITNQKYDLRKDLYQDSLMNNIKFNESMDNTLKIAMEMKGIELFKNYNDYLNTCDAEKKDFLEDIYNFLNSFCAKANNINRADMNYIYDEESLLNKLTKDFPTLTEKEIYILRTCKYLMDNGNDKINNQMISKQLDEINYPIAADVIKQLSVSIRNKCSLYCSDGGVHVLIYAIERKGYIIPPIKPVTK